MIKVVKQHLNRWLVYHTISDESCYIVKAFNQVMGESIPFFRVDSSEGITIASQLTSYKEAKVTASKSIS